MRYPEFNPAQCLRDVDSGKVAALATKLSAVSIGELREQNARILSGAYLSDVAIAGLWAINLEFTRRGIGPRWRGVGPFNPTTAPSELYGPGLPASVPRLRSPAVQRKLLLRWADLQWLQAELGPSHFPSNGAYSLAFLDRDNEFGRELVFSRIAESGHANNRIVFGLSAVDPVALALWGFTTAKAGDRCREVRRRLRDVIQPRLEAFGKRPTYAPSPSATATRLIYAEAIELARGNPTQAAKFVRWISGEEVTRQAVHKMRNKIASDLKLTGRAWR